MCILVVVKDRRPGVRFPFLLIHSREEDVRRPTAGEPQLDVATGIYAVRDQRAGGTWMGFNVKTGALVALTNRYPQAIEQRQQSLTSGAASSAPAAIRESEHQKCDSSNPLLPTSRGLLVVAALLSGTPTDDGGPVGEEALSGFSPAQRSTLQELITYFSGSPRSSATPTKVHYFQGFNLFRSSLRCSAFTVSQDIFVTTPTRGDFFEGDSEGPFPLSPLPPHPSLTCGSDSEITGFGITNTVAENSFEPRIALLKDVASAELRRVNDAVAASPTPEVQESAHGYLDDFLSRLFHGVLLDSSDPSMRYPAPPFVQSEAAASAVAKHDVTKPVFVPIAWHQERFRLLLASGLAGKLSADDQVGEKLSGTRAQTVVLVDRTVATAGTVLYCNRSVDWIPEVPVPAGDPPSPSARRSWRRSIGSIVTKEFPLLP